MKRSLAEVTWPACTSALRLDKLALGELASAEAAELTEHLAGCEKCAAAAAGLQADRQRTLPPLKLASAPALATVTPIRPLQPAQPRTRRRWTARFAAGALGLAAAASLAIAVKPLAPPWRTKGPSVALGMFVQHAGEVRAAGPGEVVAPGDSILFTVTTPREAFVAVLSLDGRGHASIYFPQAPRAAKVQAGREVPLPTGTRLDDATGEEHLLGLFCSAPVELEPVRAGLASRAFHIPDGCQVTRWSFVKR